MKDIDTDFFKVPVVPRNIHEGDMLVAEPFLTDTWFKHGVVSIIDYDREGGATGVVLNNTMNYALHEVLDGVAQSTDVPVYCGGPMSQDRLYFIHTLGEQIMPGARMYSPGLYIGGDFDAAIQYINDGYPTRGIIRFFVGYSGWGPGQLEEEIDSGSWAVLPAFDDPQRHLAGHDSAFWHEAVRSLGPAYRPWQLIPANPREN